TLVEVNQTLRDLGGFTVVAVDGHEELLGGYRGSFLRNRIADLGQVAQVGVEDGLALIWFAMHSERCLEGSELSRLETTCRLEPAAKCEELGWRKRLQNIDLRDHGLEDRQDAFEGRKGVGGVAGFESPLQECELMKELFEPEL